MRIRALFTITASTLALATAAIAQDAPMGPSVESQPPVQVVPADAPVGSTSEPPIAAANSITWTVSYAQGRLFKDQAFTLTDQPTIQNDLTACFGSTCLGIWNAWSPSGRKGDEETDLSISHSREIGRARVTGQVMFIIAEGPETWDVNLVVEHPINDACSAGIRGELMRGGFSDSVARAFVSCRYSNGSWDASVTPSVAYSDWAGGTAAGVSASAGYTFQNKVRIGLGYDGYVAPVQDGFFNLSLSVPLQ